MRMLPCTFALLLTGQILSAASNADKTIQAICDNQLTVLKQYLQHGGDANARGNRGNTLLMYASAYGTIDSMRLLLAHRADPNLKNAFDATALMWGVSDVAKVKLLVAKSADVNARAKSGKTPLLIAAMAPDSKQSLQFLAAHHADPSAVDDFGMNLIYAGADAGNLAAVQLALAHHVDVNAKLRNGMTPLMAAAADGSPEIVKLLLDAGADANAVSGPPAIKVKNGTIALGRFTPLIVAAPYSSPEVIRLLLEHGADPQRLDGRGMTALHAAVSSEAQKPETVRLLLAKGADPTFRNPDGETAQDWARKFARPDVFKVMALTSTVTGTSAPQQAAVHVTTGEAFLRGRTIMENSTNAFFKASGCVGCHSHNVTGMLAGVARDRKLAMDAEAAQARIATVKTSWAASAEALMVREDPPGGSDMLSYSLLGLAGEGYRPDLTTAAMARNLAMQQNAEGNWHYGGMARVPMEDSDISLTARAVRSLAVYEAPGTHREYQARIHRAQLWLARAVPRYAEEDSMKVLGLKWSGASATSVAAAAESLASKQHASGGWGQNDYLPEDAYATGQALFALSEAGLGANSPVFRKGIEYLLRTQASDGSWHVVSRAVKFQPYFQGGFPYDHDQWISSMGTGWATIALAVSAGR